MAKKVVQIYYDSGGNSLNVWFDDPQKEVISEEADDEVIINKDKSGKVIGFEKLNFADSKVSLPKFFPVKMI